MIFPASPKPPFFGHAKSLLPMKLSRFPSVFWISLFALVTFLAGSELAHAAEGGIGQMAQERAEDVATKETPPSKETVDGLSVWIKVLGAAMLLLVLVLLERASKLVNFNPLARFKQNVWVPRIFVGVGVLLVGMLVYFTVHDSELMLPESASEHGKDIDRLMFITIGITGVAFVVTHILLFYYSYRYRGKPDRKALYFPDNHKLEMLWTLIPAIGLAAMIIPGLKYWDNITSPEPEEEQVNVGVLGYQFNWGFRYPGKDGELGEYNFRHFTANNPLGVDTTDESGRDDFTTQEIHIPVNTQVTFHIRAKDVLHGFYLAQFRANIYAIPGMPTQFTMEPNITTEEAREQYDDPDFNFELACSQLCGGQHYTMKADLIVHSKEGYKKWVAEQEAALAEKQQSAEEPADDTEGQEAMPEEMPAEESAEQAEAQLGSSPQTEG